MTIFKHEIKQQKMMLTIWGIATGLMILLCMLTYPAMDSSTSSTFDNMGAFSSAFGMDKLSVGTLMGVYGIESGNVLAIGGTFFSALIGIVILSKEESGRTAEFLLSHPISRLNIVFQKLLSTASIVIAFNIICIAFSISSFAIINELANVVWDVFILFHLAQLFMQLEIAFICFSISASIKRGGNGIGIGVAALLYFMNLLCNLSTSAKFFKYITPYQYAEPSTIFSKTTLDTKLILLGFAYSIIAVIIGTYHYTKKDISS